MRNMLTWQITWPLSKSSFRAVYARVSFIGQKWKLVKLVYFANHFFQVFFGASKHLLRTENRDGMTDGWGLWRSFDFYVKWTASRKTEQGKLRSKDENSPTNVRRFKELLVNKELQTSSSPGFSSDKMRTS